MPELNQQTILRQIILTNVNTDGSVTSSQEGVSLTNDSDSPGANKVYGTDESGVKGWQDSISSSTIPLTDFATELTFDSDKELKTVTGGTRTFTLAASGNENGVGIVARVNQPVAVNFPVSFEMVSGSDPVSTTDMNIIVFRFFEDYDGAGNDKVQYLIKNQTAV